MKKLKRQIGDFLYSFIDEIKMSEDENILNISFIKNKINNWISVDERLPEGGMGTSENILLYIKQYRSDSGSFWSDHVIIGFWSNEYDENKGFYSTSFSALSLGHKDNALDGTHHNEFISNNKHLKITHWMPIPYSPHKEE